MQLRHQSRQHVFQQDRRGRRRYRFDSSRFCQAIDGRHPAAYLYFSSVLSTIPEFISGGSFWTPTCIAAQRPMGNLSIAAASGLRSRMVSLDLLANNLANAATGGYKNDREYYGLYASDDSENAIDGGTGTTLPVVEKQWTDFSPGVMQITGNPLDVALPNKGFFALNGPKGTLYTRNGGLQILPSGELGSSDGLQVRSPNGGTIHVGAAKNITITPDGTVQQDGQNVGQIGVVDFANTSSLRKVGSTNFENTDPKSVPQPMADPGVQQGKLEGSNVQVADAAMRLVGVMRQFEMLQKAIGVSSDMDTKSIQEVARVGS
jgi:flagellar basal-body rod protein FlgF